MEAQIQNMSREEINLVEVVEDVSLQALRRVQINIKYVRLPGNVLQSLWLSMTVSGQAASTTFPSLSNKLRQKRNPRKRFVSLKRRGGGGVCMELLIAKSIFIRTFRAFCLCLQMPDHLHGSYIKMQIFIPDECVKSSAVINFMSFDHVMAKWGGKRMLKSLAI